MVPGQSSAKEADQPILLDIPKGPSALGEDQRIDREEISRFSPCRTDVDESAEPQVLVDAETAESSSVGFQPSDQSFDTDSVEFVVSVSTRSVLTS